MAKCLKLPYRNQMAKIVQFVWTWHICQLHRATDKRTVQQNLKFEFRLYELGDLSSTVANFQSFNLLAFISLLLFVYLPWSALVADPFGVRWVSVITTSSYGTQGLFKRSLNKTNMNFQAEMKMMSEPDSQLWTPLVSPHNFFLGIKIVSLCPVITLAVKDRRP